jgi:hypothetical protein
MAFKYKPHRIKFSQEVKTLDELHNEKINKFDETGKIIELKKRKINALKKRLDEESDLDIIDRLKKKIKEYTNDVKNLETSYDELDYFEKTKDILIKYFENKYYDNSVDIPNEIEIINNNITNSDNSYDNNSDNNNDDGCDNDDDDDDDDNTKSSVLLLTSDNIMNRFNKLNDINISNIKKKQPIKKRHQKKVVEKKSILQFLSQDSSGNITDEPVQTIIHEKGKLRDQYLTLIDSSYACNKVKLSPIKTCEQCKEELTLIQSEGMFLCQKCGNATYVIIESEIPSHKDTINEKRKYPYNPINHLIEKLNQYQAKQTTKIPQDIYNVIKKELKKIVVDVNDVTPEIIQDILKKYKLDMYYEHHYLIFSHITNTPPPSLTREDEDDIKKMFKMTEKPFKLYKPKTRDNYLNYSYVLHKLFLIKAKLDTNENMCINARYFKLLKSRDKLKKQDNTWKMICKYNNWPFQSSF